MLIAIARQIVIAVTVIVLVGVSAVFWPLDDAPERKLVDAGAKLCYANDETLLVGATLEGDHVGDDVLGAAASIPSVQRLSLIETRVTKRGIQSLKTLTRLTSLNLYQNRWIAEAMHVVGTFQTLKELRLEGCEWLRDEHLAHLEQLKNLETLSLSGTPITTAGLEHIQQIPKLKVLLLDRCANISDDSINDLVRLCGERKINLSLSGTEISRAGLVRLRKELPHSMVHLRPETMVGLRAIGDRGQFVTTDTGEVYGFRRRIDIEGLVYPLRQGDLSVVGTVNSLVEINLERSNVDNALLSELPTLPKLETLRLTGTRITDDGLQVLEKLPALQTLWMTDNDLEGDGLACLRYVPALTNLRFECRNGDSILTHLGSLSKLRALTICAPLTDQGMADLIGLPLDRLELINTEVRSRGITTLSEHVPLKMLRFEGGGLNDSDLDSLANFKSLQWLVLSQTRVTRAGRNRLQKMRPEIVIQWSENL